jgi:hypothetical protein
MRFEVLIVVKMSMVFFLGRDVTWTCRLQPEDGDSMLL